MNVLIIGSGAREHALALAFHRSHYSPRIYCYGNSINPGIKQMAVDYCRGDICDVPAIIHKAKEWRIDLVFIGPEAPLGKGLVDEFQRHDIQVIGPTRQLAKIETSKRFARDLQKKYNIAGMPQYRSFRSLAGVEDFINELNQEYVIKADGLMAGKGVKVAGDHLHNIKEALAFCEEIIANHSSFIVEEKLVGQEFSLMCFSDGSHLIPMPIVQDHKRAFVDDKGPNTGGMGSYSDVNHRLPFLSEDDVVAALQINQHVLDALHVETKEIYRGILYGSFIATKNGVQVIEFNARLGDPESLNVLSILETDIVDVCQAMLRGNLAQQTIKFSPLATVCKYVVPQGYPDESVQGKPIDISAVKNKQQLFLGSVDSQDGFIIMLGSRTAAYVGIAPSISAAEEIAEREVRGIDGPVFHREDIGTDRLIQNRIDHMRSLRE